MGFSFAKVAEELGISSEEYAKLESGDPELEEWSPKLAWIAVKLQKPMSRLISETGRREKGHREKGHCGALVKKNRTEKAISKEILVEQMNSGEASDLIAFTSDDLDLIEAGDSPLERLAPNLLKFSELIDQPIFNLFCPCGIWYSKLEDYP